MAEAEASGEETTDAEPTPRKLALVGDDVVIIEKGFASAFKRDPVSEFGGEGGALGGLGTTDICERPREAGVGVEREECGEWAMRTKKKAVKKRVDKGKTRTTT